MATKRISELTLRSDVDDTCNIPVDDTLQSYRVTALQVYNYLKGKLLSTTGDMIYSSSGSTPAKLAIGTNGQLLTVAGGLPTWANPVDLPGKYHLSCYYIGSQTNFWQRTSASYGDFSVTGTIPSPTIIRNANFGTISKATSNLPGINFVAPRTGVMRITCNALMLPGQVAGATAGSFKMHESTTSTDIAFVSAAIATNNSTNAVFPASMIGYFSATSGVTYNLKLQGAVGTGTIYIGATNMETQLAFAIEYIT